ncbi:SPARC-related modular calcium-binding protein 2 isoform X4 [Cherax quadricarinatus]|uniref:SPARC-related modular calcium-binding protein 2 isoform X4 n=1 Tax=Cherax quadricarinatus TaxID=27406 RepID=UPI00387E6158
MFWERCKALVLCVALLVTSTAAQLGLSDTQRLLERPRHFLQLQLNRTRFELERQVDCNVACEDRSRDPVCGTNGHTYDNICDLDRDICKKVKVTLKHVGECSLAEKCLDERAAKQEQLANGEHVYVPTCQADGSYAPVQCHNFTFYCWCSRLDGKLIPHTIQKDRPPECSGDPTSTPAPELPQPGKSKSVGGPRVPAVHTLMSLSTATPTASTRPRPRPPQPRPKRCSGRTRKTFIKNLGRHLLKEFQRERNTKGVSEDRLLRKAVKWKFNRLDTNGDKQLKRREYRALRKPVRKFIKPKKCAKKFPRFCDTDNNSILSEDEWMACFSPESSSRHNGRNKCRNGACPATSTTVKRPKPSCERDRQAILEAASAGNNSIPIPICQPNGKYKPIQCYRDICFCVDEWTGNSLDGTVVKNGTPDCSRPLPHAREWIGCTGETKTKFILDLKKFLLNKVEGGDRSHSDTPNIATMHRHDEKCSSNLNGMTDLAETHHSTSQRSVLHNVTYATIIFHPGSVQKRAGADSSTQSVEEFAATYHFRNLDKNDNQYLEKKEKKLAKNFLKSNPKLKKCGRKITNYCDVDRDSKVSLEEWIACVVVVQNETGGLPRPPPQANKNPFETILKPEV